MQLESLLLSRDPEVIRVVQPALEKLSIDVEVCRGVNSGQEILRTERFDAIIIDCDDLKGALGVLEGLRKSVSNKNSATFAIVNGNTTTQQAFKMGANFVLQKPISALNAKRCFSAAVHCPRAGFPPYPSICLGLPPRWNQKSRLPGWMNRATPACALLMSPRNRGRSSMPGWPDKAKRWRSPPNDPASAAPP